MGFHAPLLPLGISAERIPVQGGFITLPWWRGGGTAVTPPPVSPRHGGGGPDRTDSRPRPRRRIHRKEIYGRIRPELPAPYWPAELSDVEIEQAGEVFTFAPALEEPPAELQERLAGPVLERLALEPGVDREAAAMAAMAERAALIERVRRLLDDEEAMLIIFLADNA